jgi:hypothetical protein
MEPSRYAYKMVQLPQTYVLKKDTGHEISDHLESLVLQMGEKGWEFYRIDSVGVAVNPGCLAAMLGQKQSMTYYNIVTFRQEKKFA